jgi:hypothetical protein
MATAKKVSVADHLRRVPAAVRPIVEAARRTVTAVAPKAAEVAYQGGPPKSKTFMWKIARYQVNGEDVVGIGTFPSHSTIFFYRGRELDDAKGLLQGSGRDTRFVTLRSAADAASPAVKRLVQGAFRLERT